MSNKKETSARKSEQIATSKPELRFPEFSDAPDWEFWPLRKLAKRRLRRNSGTKITRVLTNSAELGVVEQRSYFEKDIANLGNLEGYFIVDAGDYVYNPRISSLSPVGPINKNQVGLGVMSPLYTVFSFNSSENDFYSQYFKTSYWHGYLRRVSNSGARHDRMAISTNDFVNMPLPVPEKREREKVTRCLSSIDDLITAETDKLETIEDHKKGLIRVLFPTPQESRPEFRFPEFRNDSDWSWKTVGEIAKLYKGKGISKADIAVDGVQPCIRYGELYTLYGTVIQEVESTTNLDPSDLFLSKTNDVIIPASGETKIEIATSACVLESDIALGGDLNIIRSQENGIFLSYFFNGPLKYEIAKVAQGDSVVHLYPKQIAMLRVALPSMQEQAKIARCLMTLEMEIEAIRGRIQALGRHKKGLAQKLFSNLEEVRG